MFFLLRQYNFKLASKLNNINLKKLNYNFNKYLSIRSDLGVSDKCINNYIKLLSNAHINSNINNYENDNDKQFFDIINKRQVSEILTKRLKIQEDLKNLKELVDNDEEMKKLAQDEYNMYNNTLSIVDDELLEMILNNIGRDDCQSIIFEITAGVGGLESMVFAADLYNMYQGHLNYLGYNYEIIELNNENGVGASGINSGIRTASILINGYGSYELLRHEGGVHRVQRIPTTEKHGRIHTSTASVVVLPQLNDIEINIQDKDLKIETKRASGAGGQSVNTTDSAVRITHLPTGISVESQTDRSQLKNRQTAMLRLKNKIYDLQYNEQKQTTGTLRKKQRGLSLRNEKIRTYNYNQDRITDHRIPNGTMHNLKTFMQGGESLKNLQIQLQKYYQLKLFKEFIEKCNK